MNEHIQISYLVSNVRALAGYPQPDSSKNYDIINNFKEIPFAAYTINDHSAPAFMYASESVKNLIGYTSRDLIRHGFDLTVEACHPEDINRMVEIHKDIFKLCLSIPAGERSHYKFCNDFRMKRPDGEYIWLLHELSFLSADHNGFPLHSISMLTDISSFKRNDTLSLRIVKNNSHWGALRVFSKQYSLIKGDENLTRREIEILKMIGGGFLTKQIADKLHISVFTVNTHRQHMLRKTNTHTMCELMNYGFERGLI